MVRKKKKNKSRSRKVNLIDFGYKLKHQVGPISWAGHDKRALWISKNASGRWSCEEYEDISDPVLFTVKYFFEKSEDAVAFKLMFVGDDDGKRG